jgi:1,4-dihydroxy-6-naphthoate synthase
MTSPVRLRLAHSPDADDLVMFWPLVGRMDGPLFVAGSPLVDPGRFAFDLVGRDVEELNKLVVGEPTGGERTDGQPYDITAISCAAYPRVADRYAITRCGASFGEGYGPKLVVRAGSAADTPAALAGRRVAIPGRNTTAFLTLSLLLRDAGAAPIEPVEMLFSDIPGAVAAGAVDAGVLIHEAQLGVEALGLRTLTDLGAWWTAHTGSPLPLGLNVIRRDLDARFGHGTLAAVGELLAASVRTAAERRADSVAFLRSRPDCKPEWRDDALVARYLDMYVSPMTVDMGDRGRAAIARLLGGAAAAGLCPVVGPVGTV